MMVGLFSFILSWILVGLVRWGCFKFHILDIPNARSSHQIPTALMGGIGFVLASNIGFGIWSILNPPIEWRFVFFLGLGNILAIVSLIDDMKKLSPLFRFCMHFLLAVGVMALGITLPSLEVAFIHFNLGLTTFIFTLIFIIAMINIYNFMDGIDGYAGGVGLLGSIALAGLFFQQSNGIYVYYTGILSVSILGFLFWNYPKAKIFMGDIGSAFLGFIFSGLSILLVKSGIPIIVPVMIFGVFIMDGSITLIRRIINKEKIWEAHRTHFYQLLNKSGWSHQKIIWLEYCHMVICIAMAYFYQFTSNMGMKSAIVILFLLSFTTKFISIQYFYIKLFPKTN